jgi:chromosome segregation ATPase
MIAPVDSPEMPSENELVSSLLDEAYALRIKNERLSQYAEGKIGELVAARREMEQLRSGLETTSSQRNELLARVELLERQVEDLLVANTASLEQRDRLRDRIVGIESSPEYLRAQRLGRLFRFFIRSTPPS